MSQRKHPFDPKRAVDLYCAGHSPKRVGVIMAAEIGRPTPFTGQTVSHAIADWKRR